MRWISVAGLAIFLVSAGIAAPVHAQQVESGSVNFSGLLATIRAKLIGVAEEPEAEPEPEVPVAVVEPTVDEHPPEDIVAVAVEDTTPQNLVEEVQILLTDLGYKPGNPDGVVGPTTIRALEEFQRNQGVPVDGEMSVELLTQLQTVRAAAAVLDNQSNEPIVVASGSAGESEKTPILDVEPVVEVEAANVDRFEIVGVSLGDSLGSVRRLRPFDQKGELDESQPLVTARFGGSEGEILRKLEVRFGPENKAVWVRLEQGNFPIDAIAAIAGNLCERYGETTGCMDGSAALLCDSSACRKGIRAHEMRWRGDGGKVLEAVFFTGGSTVVTQVVLTLTDNAAVEEIERAAGKLRKLPDAEAFKL